MRFDTGQVLELAGISKEMLRHWKKALPPLFGRDGRSDRYSYAELVSLCMIAQAVTKLGIPVSRFTGDAVWIFEQVEQQLRPGAGFRILCVLADRVDFLADDDLSHIEAASIIRLELVVGRLSQQALSGNLLQRHAQLDLPFGDAKILGMRARR